MKKTIILGAIVSTFFLTGCATDEQIQTSKEITSNQETQSKSVPTEEITKKTLKKFSMPEVDITISLPEEYSITKSNEESRRGSFVSYDFQYKQPWNEPAFQEIQFFSEDSIKQFTTSCTDGPCIFGDYPDIERFVGQKNAFNDKENYGKYELKKFGNRYYFVSSFKCTGDSCSIREYTTFIGDTKVDIWVNIPYEVTEGQADDLFEHFKLVE